MKTTLGQAKAEARRLLQSSDYPAALRAYEALVSAVPTDYEVRFKIADVLARVGLDAEAADVYRAMALHDIRSGHPLPAVVACDALEALGQPADDLRETLAATYASGSPHLARFAVRPAPVDPDTPVDLPDPGEGAAFDELAARARTRALDLSAFVRYQEQYHPLPFFSELGADALMALLRSLTVQRLADGAFVVKQGDPGTALYLVAAGELRVLTSGPDGVEREVARLYENTLFGEMAFITDQVRTASVAVVGEADVIEVSRATLDRLTTHLPAIKEVLDRFTRERLIKNLLATSPLFTPFTKTQQSELLRRFEGLEVDPGTEIIRQGEPGQGLYVVLSGQVRVLADAATDAPVELARLGAGDIFGEMSVLTNQPTTASVQAAARATLLFLARTYVERLAAAIPEVRAYFERLIATRARDTSLRLGRLGPPMEFIEVDESDVLLV